MAGNMEDAIQKDCEIFKKLSSHQEDVSKYVAAKKEHNGFVNLLHELESPHFIM